MYYNELHMHEPLHCFPTVEQLRRGKRVANFDYLPVQADWAEKDPREISFILNKPPFALSVNGVKARPEEDFDVALVPSDLGIHALENDEIFRAVDTVFMISEVTD